MSAYLDVVLSIPTKNMVAKAQCES